jgi:alpha-L-rhamnosidase
MRKLFICIISIASLWAVESSSVVGKTTNEVSVTGLSVEMLSNPVGLGTSHPRFSWKLESSSRDVLQKDYRILVASSMKNLDKGIGDIWDSGVVESDQSLYIPFGGKSLESGARYYWKVRVSTNKGICAWAKPAFWQMALLSPSEWKAQWIGGNFPSDNIDIEHTQVLARYLRKEFNLNGKIRKATLYISGLGLYQAYLNGKMLGSVDGNDVTKGTQYLSPTLSDYNKTVYYNTFDVTTLVNKGGNAIGVMLGNGRYVKMRQKNVLHYDMPKLLFQMEVIYADGHKELVCSDTSWQISVNGPVRTNNEWDGETYDATKEQAFYGWTMPGYVKANAKSVQAQWKSADKVAAPTGVLTAQQNPNIQVMDYVHSVNITELPGTDRNGNKTYILDMGQNMVGWLQFKNLQSNLADTVTLRFAETLKPDGSLYMANLRKALVTDSYFSSIDNKQVCWHPTFIYHGFRYVEVKGFKTKPTADNFIGVVLYDNMSSTAELETSNEVINTVFKNAYWGIRGNYRGMPTDCPQRDERMGWLGDRTTGCYGEAYMFDNHQLYSKWLRDIEEAQDEAGSLPNVVPVYWNTRNDNMTWPAAFITAADMVYEQYGDSQPVALHYAAMKKWLAYMKGKYGKDGIITKDRYGDWCMPPESLNLIHSKDPSRITKGPLLSTAFYYYLCGIMSKFAPLAGHPEDAQFYANEQEVTKSAFNKAYFNESRGLL